jgi:hypothetical protein
MKLLKTKFEIDTEGIYITPLLGYSNVKGEKSIWIGWLFWLFVVRFGK